MKNLTEIFGERVLKLHTGAMGLRCGLHMKSSRLEGDQPIIRHIASDNTVDRYNEVVEPDGWDITEFRKNPMVQDSNNYSSLAFVVGKAVNFEVKDGRLLDDVLYALDNPLGKLAFDLDRNGFLPTQSVGFIPLDGVRGTKAGEPSYRHTKQSLLEISPVVIPANPSASNLELAYKSGAIEKHDLREVLAWLKHFCGDKAEPGTNPSSRGAGFNGEQLLQALRGIVKRT